MIEDQFIAFVLEIIVPIVFVIGILSGIARNRDTAEMTYALIGILASKGHLDIEDLAKLKLFEPKSDTLSEMIDLVRMVK